MAGNPLAPVQNQVLDRTCDPWEGQRSGRIALTDGTGFHGCCPLAVEARSCARPARPVSAFSPVAAEMPASPRAAG